MPVITIKALPQDAAIDPSKTIKRLCLGIARIMGIPSQSVWAHWETIKPGFYVEGDSEASCQPKSTHPPVVEIMLFEGRPPELLEEIIEGLASVLSSELGIESGNIFITMREIKKGRVFSGGSIRR